MAEEPNLFKKPKPRKKEPVKRVAISDETKRAYEELMQKRDAEEREYRTHLDGASKPR